MVKYMNVGDTMDLGLRLDAAIGNITFDGSPETPMWWAGEMLDVVAALEVDDILRALRACRVAQQELDCTSAAKSTLGMCVGWGLHSGLWLAWAVIAFP